MAGDNVSPRRRLLGLALVSVAAVIFSPIGISLVLALQVAPLPPFFTPVVRFLHSFTFVFPLIWLGLALGSPAFVMAAVPIRRLRVHLAAAVIVWIVSWLSWPLGRSLDSLRQPGLVGITRRAEPLVDAIESFRTAEGRYPNALSELVPKFLDKIPITGAVGYPEFRYSLANTNTLFRNYEVLIRTPVGGFNWDVFVFWPENTYPREMYGGEVEQIGRWAYVHE